MTNLIRCLTLSHVPRWAIIDTIKNQSVGEHTFRTMVICKAIAEFLLDHDVHVDMLELFYQALIHDMEEAKTGDIPSPFKRELFGDKLDKKYTDEGLIIKLADTIEPIIFLRRYGVRSNKIEEELKSYCEKTVFKIHEQFNFNGHVLWQFRIFIEQVIREGGDYE